MNSSRQDPLPQAEVPSSPFFRPRVRRVPTFKSPGGTRRPHPNKEGDGDDEKKSSVLGAYANLCNVTIGAGIVGLPFAIKEAGLVAGTLMIIMCAILTDYSLRLIINIGKVVRVNSYETLMEAAYGRAGFLFVSLNMFFLSFGSMVAYLTIIKDVLPVLFGVSQHDAFHKRIIMSVSSFLVILPLSMQRDMANLEKTSSLNVVLNICLVALVVGFSPVRESVEAEGGIVHMIKSEQFLDLSTFFVGFGVCSFAFVCQDSSFIIAGSMKTPSKQRWKKVANGAMLTCCTLELIMGVVAYLAYQHNTMGNVLNNMNANHWSGVVSRAMLATTMFFAYPMNLYVARHACVVLFFEGIDAHDGDDHNVLKRRDRRIILTCVLYSLSLIPAILMDSTGKILAITGAFAGSCLAYIVPGLTYLAIHSDEFIELIHKQWGCSASLWGFPQKLNRIDVSDDDNTSPNLELVVGGVEAERPPGLNNRSPIRLVLNASLWYMLGMPIWSSIAQMGQSKLMEYHAKEGMASPSIAKPKRISLVEPTQNGLAQKQTLATGFPIDTELTALLKSRPGAPYGTKLTTAGIEGVNKMIAAQNNQIEDPGHSRTNSLTSVEVEEELEKENPTWIDFHIAIAYIVLGVVALVFGLVSICCETN